MKKIYLIASIALAGVWILRAQTNTDGTNNTSTNAAAEILALVTTNAPPPKPKPIVATDIYSGSWDYYYETRQMVYHDNVRVENPQLKLTCAQLIADFSTASGRIKHIVAETNVVIDGTDEKGATNHITCGKMVYDYNVRDGVTNDTVTLTGNPQIVNAQGTNTADKIVWDRTNGHIHETNPHMSGQTLGGASEGTNNLSPAKLF